MKTKLITMKKVKCVKKKIIMNWKYTFERWLEDGKENYLGKSTLRFAIEKGNLDFDLKILILMIIYTSSNLCYVHKKRYAYQMA